MFTQMRFVVQAENLEMFILKTFAGEKKRFRFKKCFMGERGLLEELMSAKL
jgi:hypothetical protein